MKHIMIVAALIAALLLPASSSAESPQFKCDNTRATAYTVDDPSIHVVVAKGDSCYVIGAEIHSVRAKDAKHVYILDTAVAHNVMVQGTTHNTVIGDRGCNFDPVAGNNVMVKDSHNVAICYMTVDNNIRVTGNDGRLVLRYNDAGNNIHVVDNLAYDRQPGDGKHRRIGAIRFHHNAADNHNDLRRNSGRKVLQWDNSPEPRL